VTFTLEDKRREKSVKAKRGALRAALENKKTLLRP
jgi:hypothetical protein